MAETRNLSNAEIISNDTFERVKNKKIRKKIIRNLSYVSVAIILCAIFAVVCIVLFFNVEIIEVSGSDMYNYDAIIQSSGIEVEQNMFSFNSREINAILTMKYPYIENVKIKRRLPTTVEIVLTEDSPYYYTFIIDEYFVLSDSFRVLERTDDMVKLGELIIEYNLVEIVLPAIKYAVVGKKIIFTKESDYDYAVDLLNNLSITDIYPTINKINMKNKDGIYVISSDSYRINLGDDNDVAIKIDLAEQIIEKMEYKMGIIYVNKIGIGSLRQANNLELE